MKHFFQVKCIGLLLLLTVSGCNKTVTPLMDAAFISNSFIQGQRLPSPTSFPPIPEATFAMLGAGGDNGFVNQYVSAKPATNTLTPFARGLFFKFGINNYFNLKEQGIIFTPAIFENPSVNEVEVIYYLNLSMARPTPSAPEYERGVKIYLRSPSAQAYLGIFLKNDKMRLYQPTDPRTATPFTEWETSPNLTDVAHGAYVKDVPLVITFKLVFSRPGPSINFSLKKTTCLIGNDVTKRTTVDISGDNQESGVGVRVPVIIEDDNRAVPNKQSDEWLLSYLNIKAEH